jgi:VanZ family protein
MKRALTHLKLVAWIIVIGILCFTPGDELNKVHINIPYFDKIVHFGMFFILASLIKGLYWKNHISSKVFYYYITLAVVYGVIIEIVQALWINMRSGDFVDWLFDCTGIALAVITFRLWPKKLKILWG